MTHFLHVSRNDCHGRFSVVNDAQFGQMIQRKNLKLFRFVHLDDPVGIVDVDESPGEFAVIAHDNLHLRSQERVCW